MEFTAKAIADYLHGRVEGDETVTVSTFTKIEDGCRGALTFLSNAKYAHYVYTTEASVVLVDEDIELAHDVKPTLIRVKNARDCVALLLQFYEAAMPKKTGVSPLAFISSKAQVADDCYVAPFAYVGDGAVVGKGCALYPGVFVGDNVKVGNGCTFYPNVTVYHDCVVGNNVILHSGCVVGADGFGFAPTEKGYDKIPQIGIVTIEDDVEIGANTCVDRSTMGSTYIRRGVKLDNLVQIAHNTDIGQHTVMSSQVGIAGSTKVGQWCAFAGQVGISGHINIGDHVQLGAKKGVPSSIESNKALIGIPPMPQAAYFRMLVLWQRLPEMYKQISELQKEIDELKRNKA